MLNELLNLEEGIELEFLESQSRTPDDCLDDSKIEELWNKYLG